MENDETPEIPSDALKTEGGQQAMHTMNYVPGDQLPMDICGTYRHDRPTLAAMVKGFHVIYPQHIADYLKCMDKLCAPPGKWVLIGNKWMYVKDY